MMLRKIIAGALVFIAISTFSTMGYAIDGNDADKIKDEKFQTETMDLVKDENALEIISPEEELITTDSIVLLSGKAEKGSKVIVEVYSKRAVSQLYLPISLIPQRDEIEKEGLEKDPITDYDFVYREDFEVGDLGVFCHELDLVEGRNKIRAYLVKDGELISVIDRHVTLTSIDFAKEQLEKMSISNFLETLKTFFNSMNKLDIME